MSLSALHRDRIARSAFWLAPGLAAGFAANGRIGLGLAAMSALHAPLLAGTLWAGSPWFGPVLHRLDSDDWLLTIDDGPDPRDTPRLLRVLEEFGLPAMFYFVGAKVQRHRGLVKEVAAAGHGIGNHSWSHPTGRWWAVSAAQATTEIERCQDVLGDLLGEAPGWFRAPVGMANPWVHAAARRAGLRLMGWNVRGCDGTKRTWETVVRTLERQLQRQGAAGSIVLLHEAHPDRGYAAEDLLRHTIGLLQERSGRG